MEHGDKQDRISMSHDISVLPYDAWFVYVTVDAIHFDDSNGMFSFLYDDTKISKW